jgi:hypothetical protein
LLQQTLIVVAMAHMGVSIRKTTTILCDGMKAPWVIQNSECIEGVDFIALPKCCTGFSRFVSGSTRGIANMTFMNMLKELRTAAVTGARGGACCAFEATTITKYDVQRLKRRCVVNGLPEFVEITIPECEHEGNVVPAHTMKVKATTDDAAALCVELTAENLACIKAGMLASMVMKADNAEQVISPDKAVRWRGDRQAFLANRGSCSSPGKLEWKTFKPTIDSDKTDCMDKAVKWARRD